MIDRHIDRCIIAILEWLGRWSLPSNNPFRWRFR
jgi:hypothetical protein